MIFLISYNVFLYGWYLYWLYFIFIDFLQLFNKPKISAVEAKVDQKEIDSGFFVDPNLKIVAESQAKATAEQAEKKAPSGVFVSALVSSTKL